MDDQKEREWFFLQFESSFAFHAHKDDIPDLSLEIEIRGEELGQYPAGVVVAS